MRPLSVILCTRNRCVHLAQALNYLAGCAIPQGWEAEFLIVDNGSSDATKKTVTMARRRFCHPLRYIYEPTAGLSWARNAGVSAAAGELIAFTDDDCEVSSAWLTELAAAFEEYADAAAVFGQVRIAEGAPTEHAVAFKLDAQPKFYRYPASPLGIGHGNNMAFRREALSEVGEFDVALGAGGPLRSAEDLDIAYRLLRHGYMLVYDPRCVIFHRPRETAAQLDAAHWRNAVGIGACFGKYLLRGDLQALKCLYWLLSGLPASALRQLRRREYRELKMKWLYAFGIPYGIMKRSIYLLYGTPRPASLSGSSGGDSVPS